MDIREGEVPYLHFSHWVWPWLIHGFSTRKGGVSSGYWHSLNMDVRVGDVAQDVEVNENRLYHTLGLEQGEPVVAPQQVHGVSVSAVSESQPRILPDVDGLITDARGLFLRVVCADCVPLYFVVPHRRIVGLIHGGWRGALGGIGRETLKVLKDHWGVESQEVEVGLGPAIGPCCYEVGEEIAWAFFNTYSFGSDLLSPSRPGHYYLDLLTAHALVLEEEGVAPEHIARSGYCTACSEDLFFSHRRDKGKTGRMAGLIGLF